MQDETASLISELQDETANLISELQSAASELADALAESQSAEAAVSAAEFAFRQENAGIIHRLATAKAAVKVADNKARGLVTKPEMLIATGGKGVGGIGIQMRWHLEYDTETLFAAALKYAPEILMLAKESVVKAFVEANIIEGVDPETGEKCKRLPPYMAERFEVKWVQKPAAVISEKALLTLRDEQTYNATQFDNGIETLEIPAVEMKSESRKPTHNVIETVVIEADPLENEFVEITWVTQSHTSGGLNIWYTEVDARDIDPMAKRIPVSIFPEDFREIAEHYDTSCWYGARDLTLPTPLHVTLKTNANKPGYRIALVSPF